MCWKHIKSNHLAAHEGSKPLWVCPVVGPEACPRAGDQRQAATCTTGWRAAWRPRSWARGREEGAAAVHGRRRHAAAARRHAHPRRHPRLPHGCAARLPCSPNWLNSNATSVPRWAALPASRCGLHAGRSRTSLVPALPHAPTAAMHMHACEAGRLPMTVPSLCSAALASSMHDAGPGLTVSGAKRQCTSTGCHATSRRAEVSMWHVCT